MNAPVVRLTSLAHGGGCGCKLAPNVLQELLAGHPQTKAFAPLLVGTDTSDDAAVWKLDDNTCIIATTDFFMPVVDDPRDFGRIAATNAISDVYAMGGKPIFALAILGMPLGKLPLEMVRGILEGGASICAEAGIPVAGGHSIDAPEPIYGLAVIGIGKPDQVRRNADAKAGDALILTKAIGVGIYSAALKKGILTGEQYAEMVATTTLLNKVGADLAAMSDVHAITDVTGFGLLGHATEVAKGSNVSITIDSNAVAYLSAAQELAQAGNITGASHRNWASYGESVRLPDGLPEWRQHLLTDPQTSGGLLVSCASGSAERILKQIQDAGYPAARIIGSVEVGMPEVRVKG
ncbi:MAG TPA: selenide, water dikinase SelD [Xanthobacteraceae bacterium]|nr:selenide, water dikinase SelD [Xanthobacteraceae bacterium]